MGVFQIVAFAHSAGMNRSVEKATFQWLSASRRNLLGAVSRLRRVKSKAPALQRSGFCKAAVETWRAASLLLRRRLEPNVIKLVIRNK
jgi:hypothetical protein